MDLTAIHEPAHAPREPRISVVIPVLDGGERLGLVLRALARQRAAGGIEVLAVDSGSTDGSRERLRRAGVRLFAVERGRFRHGRTRNEALARTRGRRLVLLSQDAVPLGDGFLECLAAPLDADPLLAGTYARQVAPPGTDPLVVRSLERWTPPGPDRRQVALDTRTLERMPPDERVRRCRFDDVASCLRRRVWERHPLPDVPFGEDAAWARRVLTAGHDLLYRPAAVVEHAHVCGALETFRRDRAAHAMLAREFGLRTVPSPAAGAAAWLAGWGSDARDLLRAGAGPTAIASGLLRGAARRAGGLAGQYAGARAVSRSRGRGTPRA